MINSHLADNATPLMKINFSVFLGYQKLEEPLNLKLIIRQFADSMTPLPNVLSFTLED